MKKVLLTTINQPMGVENETCTKNIQAEMYHAQVTLAQGPFSIRSVCTGWGLEFIANNIDSPTTVMHYPTIEKLIKELKKNYDFVGISFVVCTFPKTIEMCKIIRKISPESKIVLGGYGTVLVECDQYADFVCREEGANFFRKLLGQEPIKNYKSPVIKRKLKIMSVTTRPEAILAAGLGCSRGCEFCCTSHFYDRNYIPLLKTGKEIHDAMMSIDFKSSPIRNIGIIDEDFLMDRNRMDEMISLNAKIVDKPIMFSCLTSLKSISQYSTEELLKMGLAGVWVGIESQFSNYPKLKGLNPKQMIEELKRVGIIPLTSMIIGYDWHDEKTVEQDFQYLFDLKPAFSQLMIYSPCPKTPLYEKMKSKGKLLNIPYKYVDGFHVLFEHPHFSIERLEHIVKSFFQREYEELGPSICRVLDVQLRGYQALKNHNESLFRARAFQYKNLSLEIYPLLKTAIKEAPSRKVKTYLVELKEKVEDEFKIPMGTKLIGFAVPALKKYTKLKDLIIPHPQPPVQINHYHLN